MTRKQADKLRPFCRVRVIRGRNKNTEAIAVALQAREEREDGNEEKERRMGAYIEVPDRLPFWEPNRNLEMVK